MRNTFRLTYFLQFIAALCILVSLFSPWHPEHGSGAELLVQPIEEFIFPISFFHPLWALWLLPVTVAMVILRASYNYVDHRFVIWTGTSRWLTMGTVVVMSWLLVVYGADVVRDGFWACLTSIALLLILTGLEGIMPTRQIRLGQDVWRAGDKIIKPCFFCGRYNDVEAHICWYCGTVQTPDERM